MLVFSIPAQTKSLKYFLSHEIWNYERCLIRNTLAKLLCNEAISFVINFTQEIGFKTSFTSDWVLTYYICPVALEH